MRFVRVLFQRVAARVDQRIQLLRGFRHEVHCNGVALRAVFHLAERVDGVVKHILGAAEIAVRVRDGHAELGISGGGSFIAVPRLLHLVGGLFERVADAVGRNTDHFGCIVKLLNGLG